MDTVLEAFSPVAQQRYFVLDLLFLSFRLCMLFFLVSSGESAPTVALADFLGEEDRINLYSTEMKCDSFDTTNICTHSLLTLLSLHLPALLCLS